MPTETFQESKGHTMKNCWRVHEMPSAQAVCWRIVVEKVDLLKINM